jgi:hypothetical protein
MWISLGHGPRTITMRNPKSIFFHDPQHLKDVGSQNTTIYTIHTGVTNFINHISDIYAFDTLLYKLSYVKENIN